MPRTSLPTLGADVPGKKLSQFRGRLEPSQIADGINAAFRNARRLCEDAELLLENDRPPSAAALAILSIEESGKASILRHLSVSTSEEEVRNRWREYRSHTKKNVMGGLLKEFAQGARKLDEFIGLFEKEAEHPYLLDQIKQIAFYTDCLGDAHWSEPSKVVDTDLATQLVQTAKILAKSKEVFSEEIELWIKHLGPVWNKDSGWMRKALENWYEEMQRLGLAPEGPNAMRAFIREGVHSADSDE
jgi:AbiV family abortive infection protein